MKFSGDITEILPIWRGQSRFYDSLSSSVNLGQSPYTLTPSPCPDSCIVSPLTGGVILSVLHFPNQLLSLQPSVSSYMPWQKGRACLLPSPEAFCLHRLFRRISLYNGLSSGHWSKSFCLQTVQPESFSHCQPLI